jgi:hypothetical protein
MQPPIIPSGLDIWNEQKKLLKIEELWSEELQRIKKSAGKFYGFS